MIELFNKASICDVVRWVDEGVKWNVVSIENLYAWKLESIKTLCF